MQSHPQQPPTCNSVIERVSKDIGNVLRILRKLSLNTLLKKILIRINFNTNISTGKPPYEIFFWESIFMNMAIESPLDYNKIISNLKLKIQRFNDKMEQKRKIFFINKANLFI